MTGEKSNQSLLHSGMFKVCSAILTMLLTLFGLNYYIDWRIDKSIQSENVINKLQTFVRPSMIFDQNGAILSDQGAYQFIDKFQVSQTNKGLVDKITITPKKPNICPILIPLDTTASYYINEDHGNGLEIIYELVPTSYSIPRPKTSLFNLEIVPGSITQYGPKSKDEEVKMYLPGSIFVTGSLTSDNKKPGETYVYLAMGEDPRYTPLDGMIYFDTRYHSLRVYSQGKWRNVLFDNK